VKTFATASEAALASGVGAVASWAAERVLETQIIPKANKEKIKTDRVLMAAYFTLPREQAAR